MDKYKSTIMTIIHKTVEELQSRILLAQANYLEADLTHKQLISKIHSRISSNYPNMTSSRLVYEVERQIFQDEEFLSSYRNLLVLGLQIEEARMKLNLYSQFGEELK